MTQEDVLDTPDPEREILRTRVMNASAATVFEAWTTPERLERWWGPAGFNSTTTLLEPREGGAWRFTMRSPEGNAYPNESVFRELVAPGRIVIDHLSDPTFRMFATFEDRGGKTEVTVLQRFGTAAACTMVKTFAPKANDENLDKLEAELTRMG